MATTGIEVGAASTTHAGWVDPDAAIAYALATDDPRELYLRGEAVHPLFTVALVHGSMGEATRRGIAGGAVRGATGAVHAQHDVHLLGDVAPGMAVRWRAETYGARQTSAGALVTQRIEVCDERGVPLVVHYWSSLHTGGTIESDVGPDLPDHTFPPAARDRPLGRRLLDVTVDQSFRYAGASGDRNPHCVDDQAARREGFPGKILQGLCTFALCSGGVLDVGTGGDPRTLTRIAGRFSAPVFPRAVLAVEVFDAGVDEQGGRVLAFEATSGGRTVVKHGRAHFRPA
ncbi:MAG TPA: MaoC/PaaZ C-terminal domain-containing protein [Acidimicrobiales bacterium]|jgi:acyl dehydratase